MYLLLETGKRHLPQPERHDIGIAEAGWEQM